MVMRGIFCNLTYQKSLEIHINDKKQDFKIKKKSRQKLLS